MKKRYCTKNIDAVSNRKIFFDANVLIYIFWPSGAQYWEMFYSAAYGKLVKQKNELLVDFTVISEVVNRAIRLQHEKHLLSNELTKRKLPYKRYRDSPEGQSELKDIYFMVTDEILSKFNVVGKAFTKEEIKKLLDVDSLDFGDKGILLTSQENDCVLFTNDSDYKNSDVDILTSNQRILNQ